MLDQQRLFRTELPEIGTDFPEGREKGWGQPAWYIERSYVDGAIHKLPEEEVDAELTKEVINVNQVFGLEQFKESTGDVIVAAPSSSNERHSKVKLKKVPTRTGPCCAPSACNPCRFAPDQRLPCSKSRVPNPKIYKLKSSSNPEQQSDPTNTAITQSTIQYTLRASVQHTGHPTVAGMYKNCTKEESPEIGI